MKPVIGVGMLGAGLLLVYGGITGRLAPMIAALFTPSLLNGDQSAAQAALKQKEKDAGLSGGGGFDISPGDFFGPIGHFLG